MPLLNLWDSTATKKDGLKTSLSRAYTTTYDDGSYQLQDCENWPESNAACSVCSATDPEDVKEILFGWTRDGNTLTGASRLYGNRTLERGDVCRLGINSKVYESIDSTIDTLEASITSLQSAIDDISPALPTGEVVLEPTTDPGRLSFTYGAFTGANGDCQGSYSVDETPVLGYSPKKILIDFEAWTFDGTSVETLSPLPSSYTDLGFIQASVPVGYSAGGMLVYDQTTQRIYMIRNTVFDGVETVVSTREYNSSDVFTTAGTGYSIDNYGISFVNHYGGRARVHKLSGLHGVSDNDAANFSMKYQLWSSTSDEDPEPDTLLAESNTITMDPVTTNSAGEFFIDSSTGEQPVFIFDDPIDVEKDERIWIVSVRTDSDPVLVRYNNVPSPALQGGWTEPKKEDTYYSVSSWSFRNNPSYSMCWDIYIQRDGGWELPTTAIPLAYFWPLVGGEVPTMQIAGFSEVMYEAPDGLNCKIALPPAYTNDATTLFVEDNYKKILTNRGFQRRINVSSSTTRNCYVLEEGSYPGQQITITNQGPSSVYLQVTRGFVDYYTAVTLTSQKRHHFVWMDKTWNGSEWEQKRLWHFNTDL